MSELHFDADGEPAKVPADADELRVRRFRKPGERGACEVVHGADGSPLYVGVDASYLEFRKLVDNVPGRYRLDPVDASRRPVSGAVPLYVTIEATRNSAAAGDDRDGLMRELMRANVEMMRANVEMTKNVTERLANMMTATAEILRAADGANLPSRTPPAAPPPDADDEDEDEDEDDDQDDETDPANPLTETIAHFLKQAMPLLETYVADRMATKRRAEQATTPSSAPAASATPSGTSAATSATPPTTSATPPATATPSATSTPTATAAPASNAPAESTTAAADSATTSAAPATAPTTPTDVRNAAPADGPTPEQLHHLIAVKAKLSPREQQVVMTAIPRMEPAARAHWLGELCALSVDDAAALVRSMMPPLRPDHTEKEHTS